MAKEYSQIRNSLVGVPIRQVINKAGEISSTVDDTTAWPDENGLKIKDGKLALSTSTSTTITNCETLYDKLWANSPASWKSGSDLIVPATAAGISETASGTITNSDAGYTMNYGEWFATREGNTCTLRFYFSFSWNSPADTTPAGFAFDGLPSSMYLQSGGGNVENKCLSIPVNDSASGWTVTTIFPRNSFSLAIYRNSALGGFTGTGTMYTGHPSIGQSCVLTYDVTNFSPSNTTPTIYLFDNVLSSSIGLPDATKDGKGLVSFGDINQVLENECINGSFDFNQRGAASYTVNGYCLDRFYMASGASTTLTTTQEQFALGQIEVLGNPEHYARCVVSTGSLANSYAQFNTRLEKLSKYSGEWVTVGVDLKADAAKDVSFEFKKYFGTGGSPSATETSIGVNKVTISDTWARYYYTAFIPSISGKVLGDNGNDFLELDIWFDAGSDFDARTNSLGNQSGTFEMANLDIKRTKNITPYTRAGGSYPGELALCQRYCYVFDCTNTNTLGYGHKQTSSNIRYTIPIITEMRALPSGSIISPAQIRYIGSTGTSAFGNNLGNAQTFTASGVVFSVNDANFSGLANPIIAQCTGAAGGKIILDSEL